MSFEPRLYTASHFDPFSRSNDTTTIASLNPQTVFIALDQGIKVSLADGDQISNDDEIVRDILQARSVLAPR